jgi:hypothetical protein
MNVQLCLSLCCITKVHEHLNLPQQELSFDDHQQNLYPNHCFSLFMIQFAHSIVDAHSNKQVGQVLLFSRIISQLYFFIYSRTQFVTLVIQFL